MSGRLTLRESVEDNGHTAKKVCGGNWENKIKRGTSYNDRLNNIGKALQSGCQRGRPSPWGKLYAISINWLNLHACLEQFSLTSVPTLIK